MKEQKFKIARVATVPFSLLGSRNHMSKLQELGAQITVVCSEDEYLDDIKKCNISNYIPVTIRREIAPFSDLISIIKLAKILKKEKFLIAHSNTPKGGLVCACAAFLAKTPIRLHTFTGQRWITLHGIKRFMLIFCDWLIGKLNTHCFADGPGQAEFLINQGIIAKHKISCIHHGAFAGIDLDRFNRQKFQSQREVIRQEINCQTPLVISFLGRLVKEKGIEELVQAFLRLQQRDLSVSLLLIGPYEHHLDPVSDKIRVEISSNPAILAIGMKADPERYLSASDIFCLPSYREGFPTVVLEAAALEIPCVGSNIVGVRDTIIHEKTGLLVKERDVDSLFVALEKLCQHGELREQYGRNACQRVKSDFTNDLIAHKNFEVYLELLKNSEEQ